MPLRVLISFLVFVSAVAAQNAPGQSDSGAALLVCPTATSLQDPASFTWSKGSKATNYRLLLGPTAGSSSNGDSSVISGLQGQLAGLPAGQNLVVTLWSYDQNGNALQPPSYCQIKTAPQPSTVAYKDLPGTALLGVSLGSFPVNGSADSLPQAAQSCQAQCKQNAGCQGYTYYPAAAGNPVAMCDLKSQITESQPNDCCLSALKTVTQSAVISAVPAPSLPPPPAPARAAAPKPANSSARAAAPAPSSARATNPAPSPAAAPAPAPARTTAAAPAAKGVTGDWVNQFGAVTKIVQQGNAISGTFSDAKQPALSGTLQGTFDGKTLRATLNWKTDSDSSHGTLLLNLTPQGTLEGTWTDAAGVDGPWSMGPAGAGAAR